jgi:hypothetical protein
MVYVHDWDEFVEQSTKLYQSNPRVRKKKKKEKRKKKKEGKRASRESKKEPKSKLRSIPLVVAAFHFTSEAGNGGFAARKDLFHILIASLRASAIHRK